MDLKSGLSKVDDYPPIKVVLYKERYFTLDNRRLWLFKNFGVEITVRVQGTVQKEFYQKLSKAGGGHSVKFFNLNEVAKWKKRRRTLEGSVLGWAVEQIMSPFLHVNKVNMGV